MKVTSDFKMVIVLDRMLSVGLQCNTSAVLALTLGNKIEGLIDKDLFDGSGEVHLGLTNQPLPILQTTQDNLKDIREKAKIHNPETFLYVDFTDAAQTTKNYEDYERKLQEKKTNDLQLLGIAIAGTIKDIKGLTGNLPLLR